MPGTGSDVYFTEGSVNGGLAVGFRLAWEQTGDIRGLNDRPYRATIPYYQDPAYPEDPTKGHFGLRQWDLDLIMIEGAATLEGGLLADWTVAQRRAFLKQFRDLSKFTMQDVDGTNVGVKMTAWEEWCIEQFDGEHAYGGWLARITVVFKS